MPGIERFAFDLPFGAKVLADGGVRFRLWAPSVPTASLAIEGGKILPMESRPGGWFELVTGEAAAGSNYQYRLPDGFLVPDPASRYQPRDVHGPSQIIDPKSYQWRHGDWRGRRWEEAVIYELHVGCFSKEGSFDGVRRHFDHLVELGVTALELMPLADFEGRRNWGYDGVLPFAPDSSYGRPEDLKRLVDEAHERGLMVLLDVVYNHFGPSGNYLSLYAKSFFTERHHTPWGVALAFDVEGSQPVRDFFIANALYWIEEFRMDGLRLDAVHEIKDDRRPHVLEEVARAVRDHVSDKREVHLILENDANDVHYLARDGSGRPLFHTAQWDDDIHHAVHVAVTGEAHGYYGDYETEPVRWLVRSLAEGFGYQGEVSRFRNGRKRGQKSIGLPPMAFVNFLQNHDQTGNRAFGERLDQLVSDEVVRALLALLLLAPEIPMLFMGEEWGSQRPFLFFCDFNDELSQAVREGRRREFGHFEAFQDPARQAEIPDPTLESSFIASRLDWSERDSARGRARLAFVRRLLALRRQFIEPLLPGLTSGRAVEAPAGNAFAIRWAGRNGTALHVAANLAATPSASMTPLAGDVIYAGPEPANPASDTLPPWAVRVTLAKEEGAP